MTAARYLPLALLTTLAACAVGPHYSPPETPSDGNWAESATSTAVDLTWWQSLSDPLLDELIHTAVACNFDLKTAEARLHEARATRDAVAGQRLPEVTASGLATRNGWSENGPIPISRIPGFERDYNLFQLGFDASWEIDLWGHNARAVEAAQARAEGADELRRATLLRVITEVARSYVDLRSAQQQLLTARADADARAEVAKLVDERYQHGEASRFDFVRADAQARSAQAVLPDLDADAHAAVYRLAVLTAQAPEGLRDRLLSAAPPLPHSPATVGAGLRSEVLQRRPDVRQAERQLAAATAQVGVNKAELFPRISLVGSVGQQSTTTGEFAEEGSNYFSIGPSLHWPIFAGGTLRANVRAAEAGAHAAAATYQNAVLVALNDSETAVNRFAAAQRTRDERNAALQQSAAALVLARQRYRAGEDDLLVLLDAQSAYSAAQQQSVSADAGVLTALISLYKALGGGWEAFEPTTLAAR
jgi:NodT family efflux transporter outer membrane factor (OMF) lipoprotein